MPRHTYVNPNNLFDDNELNESFRSIYRKRTSSGGPIEILERQRQFMLKKQHDVQQQTIASTTRSLQLLQESEDIGIAAAQELVRQRGALQNTNQCLDVIENKLHSTQKHINRIQSVFYGIKSYISGNSKQKSRKQIEKINCVMKSSLKSFENEIEKRGNNSNLYPRLRGNVNMLKDSVSNGQNVHNLTEQNLGEMVQAVKRLKLFGIALGEEIDQQIKLVDNIQVKADNADVKINLQEKDMREMLGK